MTDNKFKSNELVDFFEVFLNIKARFHFVILLAVCFFIIGHFAIDRITPVFRSKATVISPPSSGQFGRISSLLNPMQGNAEEGSAVIDWLTSRTLAQEIISRFELLERDEYKVKHSSWSETTKYEVNQHHATLVFSKNLNVKRSPESSVIEISFDSHDPELSEAISNHILDLYVNFFKNDSKARSDEASEMLTDKIDLLKNTINEAEQSLKDFEKEHDIVEIETQILISKRELEEINFQKIKLEEQLGFQRQLLIQLDNADNQLETALKSQEVIQEPAIRNLRDNLEIKKNTKSTLSQRYLEKHPKMLTISEEIKVSESNLLAAVNLFVESTRQNYEFNKSLLNKVSVKADKIESSLKLLGRQQLEFQKLLKEAEMSQSVYDNILLKFKEASMMQDIGKNSSPTVLDRAITPIMPFKPNKKFLYFFNLLASVITALLLIIVHILITDKISKFKQFTNYLGLTFRSAVPKVRSLRFKKMTALDIDGIDKKGHFKESIRTLRTSYFMQEDPAKVIALSSTKPDEGKSTIALHLARSFGELEKVLLIDADLRFPAIGKELGMAPNLPGLTNLIGRKNILRDCVHRDVLKGVDVMPAGLVWTDPLSFLSNKRFGVIIKALSKYYDRIVIECPPIMSVSDALLVSKCVEDLEIVVDSEKTSLSELSEVTTYLMQSKVPVKGIILNKVKSTKQYYYSNKKMLHGTATFWHTRKA